GRSEEGYKVVMDILDQAFEKPEGNKRPRVCKTCSSQGHDSRNCKSKEIDTIDRDLCGNGADVLQLTDGIEEIHTVQVE
ncbi:hypothetical protein MKW94_024134, partial [Papaver nudicaule]|nr:hypothetical protein [Papaver nudicaule]